MPELLFAGRRARRRTRHRTRHRRRIDEAGALGEGGEPPSEARLIVAVARAARGGDRGGRRAHRPCPSEIGVGEHNVRVAADRREHDDGQLARRAGPSRRLPRARRPPRRRARRARPRGRRSGARGGPDREQRVAGEARQEGRRPVSASTWATRMATVGAPSARRVTGRPLSAWSGSSSRSTLDLGEGGGERGDRAAARRPVASRDLAAGARTGVATYCSTSARLCRRTSPETRLRPLRHPLRPCA